MRSFARGRRGATRRPAPPVAAAAAVTQWPLQTLHIDERAAVNHLLALPMTHPCVRRREEPPRCSSEAANETPRIRDRYRTLTGIIGVLGAFPIRFARLLGLLALVLAALQLATESLRGPARPHVYTLVGAGGL